MTSLNGDFSNGQSRGALIFSLICTWTYSWAKNSDAGDLRGHRAPNDITVMTMGYVYLLDAASYGMEPFVFIH